MPNLFDPLTMGEFTLRNRVIMAPLIPDLERFERRFGVRICTAYGMTETVIHAVRDNKFERYPRLAMGRVDCWGDNTYGQLGDGHASGGYSPIPVRVEGPANTIQITAGSAHACAILSDGSMRCWGPALRPQAQPCGPRRTLRPLARHPA